MRKIASMTLLSLALLASCAQHEGHRSETDDDRATSEEMSRFNEQVNESAARSAESLRR